jgi:RHS repeat-associated protein
MTTNVYDSHGLPTSIKVLDAAGQTLVSTSFGYDNRGFATTILSTDAGTNQLAYDNAGNVTNIVDALGHATRFAYDRRGFATNTVDALTGRTVRTYNSVGRLSTVVDPLLHTNTFLWTASGRPAGIRFPTGGQTTNEYDAADRLVAAKDVRSNRVAFALDAIGRVTQRSTPNWQELTWFDITGCATARLDAVSGRTDTGYDTFNRPVSITDPMRRVWTNTFDALDSLTGMIDPKHRTTSYTLDSMDRRIGIAYPSGRTESYGLDGLGRMAAFTNSEGRVYRLAYDGQSRLVAATNAANEQVFRNYFDPCGNLTNHLDGAARSTRRQFDILNRCTNTVYADGSAEGFTFDAAGNLLTARNATTTNTFAYDSMDRLTSSVSRVAGVALTNKYRYDVGGLATNLVYPDGKTVRYDFDADGRMTNVVDWAQHAYRITRDAAGRVTTLVYSNGISGVFGYDANHALTNWIYSGTTGLPGRCITRDVIGLKTREDITSGPMSVPAADRRAVSTFNAADRLVAAQLTLGTNTVTENYLYDPCGALTNIVRSTGTNDVYAYDLAGRMTAATASNLSLVAFYDALGNRVKTTVNGVTRLWVVDHTDPLKRPLMETTTNGTPVRYYVWGAGRLLAAIDADGTTRYAHCDDQGSVVAFTSTNGAVLFTANYGPYGEPWGTTGTNVTPFGWLGGHGVFHAGGGSLYLTRYRAYDTTLKRFLSQDPLGLGGGPNVYAYALGNPLSYIDPLGLGAESSLWFDRWGNHVAATSEFIQEAVNNAYPWGIAGTLNTVVVAASGFLSTPQAIGHLGEGSGTFAGNPSWETAPGMLMDVSLAASVMAAGMAPLPSANAPLGTRVSSPGSSASAPVGRRTTLGGDGSQTPQYVNPQYQSVQNTPATIGGRAYSGHALDQMQNRGVVPSVVENTVATGTPMPGNTPGTTVFHDPVNHVRVVVNQSGRVVTVE